MTAIIGIKMGNEIVLASDGITTTGDTYFHISNKSSYKVFEVIDSPKHFVAFTGDVASFDFLRKSKEFSFFEGRSNVTYDYLVKRFVPRLFKISKKYALLDVNEKRNETLFKFSLLITTPSKMFIIRDNGVVIEHNEMICAGSGQDQLAMKYLEIKDKYVSPREIAIECLKSAIKFGPSIGYPITIASNIHDFEVIND